MPCPHDLEHGTLGAYTNHGCHCDLCRENWARYIRGMRVRRRLRVQRVLRAGGEDPIPHGTNSGYESWGCTCRPCRLAHAEYGRDRYVRRRGRGREHPGVG